MMIRRALTLVIVCAVAAAAYAQLAHVTRVANIVRPKVYNGPCPVTLTFTATIFVAHPPAMVTYRWARSDGALSQNENIRITSAGSGVTDTWSVGTHGQHLRLWQQLQVFAPNGLVSPRAVARVNCR